MKNNIDKIDERCVYFDKTIMNNCSLLTGQRHCNKCSFKKYKEDILPENEKYVYTESRKCCYQNPIDCNICDLLKEKICKIGFCSFKNENMTLQEREELFKKYTNED